MGATGRTGVRGRRVVAGLAAVLLLSCLAGTTMAVLPPSAAAEVPGQRILFGATPDGAGATRADGLARLEQQLGRRLDYVRVFELWDSAFPTAYHDGLVSKGQVMALSVRARRTDGSTVPWADIATMQPGSALYVQLQSWITRIMALGTPVWFTFNHEPEIVANQANGTDADYVAAWRRVVQEFRARGASNVQFSWILTGYAFEVPATDRRSAARWYPGDAYVDHIAADSYNWSTCRAGVTNPWRSFTSVVADFKRFGALHPTERLVLTEWASAEQGGDKAAWIDEAAALMKQPGYEQFMAMSYYNRLDPTFPGCAWSVDSSPAAASAFVRMARDPFYGGPGASTPAAPVIGTARPGVAGGAVTATATWGPPASDGGAPLLGYRVRALRLSSTGTVLSTTTSGLRPAASRSFEMSLPQAGSYRFTVQAVNATGSGPQSRRSNLVAGR